MFETKEIESGEIYIGNTKMGNRVFIDASSPIRCGICASSGSGKTVLLTSILMQLCRTFRSHIALIGFDPKLVSLKQLSPRFSAIVTEPSEYLPTLLQLEQVMNSRLRIMESRNWDKIDPLRHGEEFPNICVVVEELPSFLGNSELSKQERDSIVKWFDRFLTMSRCANMSLILCSHSFSSSECGLSVLSRSQLSLRFIGRCGLNEANLFSEGQTEKANVLSISGAGEFYIAQDDLNQWKRFKTWYTSPEKAYEVATALSIDNRDLGIGWNVSSPWE